MENHGSSYDGLDREKQTCLITWQERKSWYALRQNFGSHFAHPGHSNLRDSIQCKNSSALILLREKKKITTRSIPVGDVKVESIIVIIIDILTG